MRALTFAVLSLTAIRLWADVASEAQDKVREGKVDEAAQLLRDDIAKNPGSVSSSSELTDILRHQEKFEEADSVVNSALKLNPNSAELHRVRGDLVFREGQVFEAESEYRTAYKLDNKNARALYGIARAYEMGALRAKAIALIKIAYKMDPSDEVIEEAYNRLNTDTLGQLKQWQEELDGLKDQGSRLAKNLKRAIATEKELNGRHPWELASAYSSYQIPLGPLYDGKRPYGIGSKVAVNGVKADIQVDTGASGLYIGSKLAERAGVKRIAEIELNGIGNQSAEKGWLGFAERVQIGDVEFRNCLVDVSISKSTVIDAGGLMGTDIFRRFMVTLNLRARRMQLDPLPGPAWDGVAPVDRYNGPELSGFDQFLNIHHFLLIPVKVSEKLNQEQTPGLFLLDTGASGNAISTNLAPDVTKVRNNNYGGVKGISGKVKMTYRADQIVLQFGHFRQQIPDLMAFDLTHISRNAGAEVSGLMGIPLIALFESISLDYRDGRIKYSYKP